MPEASCPILKLICLVFAILSCFNFEVLLVIFDLIESGALSLHLLQSKLHFFNPPEQVMYLLELRFTLCGILLRRPLEWCSQFLNDLPYPCFKEEPIQFGGFHFEYLEQLLTKLQSLFILHLRLCWRLTLLLRLGAHLSSGLLSCSRYRPGLPLSLTRLSHYSFSFNLRRHILCSISFQRHRWRQTNKLYGIILHILNLWSRLRSIARNHLLQHAPRSLLHIPTAEHAESLIGSRLLLDTWSLITLWSLQGGDSIWYTWAVYCLQAVLWGFHFGVITYKCIILEE